MQRPGLRSRSGGIVNPQGRKAPAARSFQAASAPNPPGAPYPSDASYAQYLEAGADGPFYARCYFVVLSCARGTPTSGWNLALVECAKLCPIEGGVIERLYAEGAGCLDGSVLTATPGVGCRVRTIAK